ncbi:YadA-like family protein [Moraxella lincolnii]|uniref:YadA-like family protein n=1 Tax=Lwoffella lincolnii TaxID=90241 RepID=UPI0030D2C225
MNHIYKVVFNKATGTFTAVAEYAKSHTGGGGDISTSGQVGNLCTVSFTRVATLAILSIAAIFNTVHTANASISIGGMGSGTNSKYPVKNSASANGQKSIALGANSTADGDQSIAIGSSEKKDDNSGAKAKGKESIAIGGDVTAQGHASIAIGSDDLYINSVSGTASTLTDNTQNLINKHTKLKEIQQKSGYQRTQALGHASMAIGTMSKASGDFSNALGTRAEAEGAFSLAMGLTSKAAGESSVAVGSSAEANKTDALALGANTKVEAEKGIALGAGSEVTSSNNSTDAYVPQGGSIDSHKATATGALSIGSSSIKRKIINVGAGNADTDAVNVAQLKAVEEIAKKSSTWKLKANGGNSETINNNDEVDFAGKKTGDGPSQNQNIKITRTGKKVEFDLSDTIKLGNSGYLSVGNSTLNSGGLNIINNQEEKLLLGADGLRFTDKSNTPKTGTTRITNSGIGFSQTDGRLDTDKAHITNTGINAGNQKITKVADGQADTDAVNKKQVGDLIDEKVKSTKLTVNDNSSSDPNDPNSMPKPRFEAEGQDKKGFVNAEDLSKYLNELDQSIDITRTTAKGAVDQSAEAKTKAEQAAEEAKTSSEEAKKAATSAQAVEDIANKALQTFKVEKEGETEEENKITVAKDKQGSHVNTLKLKGDNGINVTTNKNGTITFGIDQSNGLTTPKLTVGNNTNDNGNKLSIDKENGIHFLSKGSNQKDMNAPAITKDGISAGNKTITGVKPTLIDIINTGTTHTIEQGNTITKEQEKSNAASVKDVLNAGFNLKNNGRSVDFVSAYDTIDFVNGNGTTANVTYTGDTNKVTYNVNVDNKTINLTGNDGNKQLSVKTTTLTKTDANGQTPINFSVKSEDDDALIKAKDIKENLNILAKEINTAKNAKGGSGGSATSTLTIKAGDDTAPNNNGITLDSTNSEMTLAGSDGITVKSNTTDRKITVGIDTTKGLTVGKTSLKDGSLSVSNQQMDEQIQVGADGIKFANVNAGMANTNESTTRITKDKIGFANSTGQVDENKPHLTKDGIDAGGQTIKMVKSAIDPSANNQKNFITRLEEAGKTNTDKQNSAATVKDLYELSQSPLTFAGDIGSHVTKKLGDTLTVKGGEANTGKLTDGNIGVVADSTNGLTVKLAKTLTGLEAVNTKTLTATDKITAGSGNSTSELLGGGLTFNKKANSTINTKTHYGIDGVKFTDGNNTAIAGTTYITKEKVGFAKQDGSLDESKPYLDQKQLKVGDVAITKDNGIDAGNQKITKLADGQADTDAVNKKQVNQLIQDKVKSVRLTVNNNSVGGAQVKNRFEVRNEDKKGFVAAEDLSTYLNELDQSIDTTKRKADNAIAQSMAAKAEAKTAAEEAKASSEEAQNAAISAKSAEDTANKALQTFTVSDGTDANNFTVGKNEKAATNQFNKVTFTGENGIKISSDKATGKVKVGIDQNQGLTTSKLTVGDHTGGNKVIIDKNGINAGNQKIINIADGTHDTDAVSYKQHKQIAEQIKGLDPEALKQNKEIAEKLKNIDKSTLNNVANALQTFTVEKEGETSNDNKITVGKNVGQDKVNTLKLKGDNGINITTNKNGTVTFGIDQNKGLTSSKLTVGNGGQGQNKGIVIDSKNGQNTITGLTHTLTDATNPNTGHVSEIKGLAQDADKTRAASIGDVLNAGFNLQGNGTAVDFVSTYDTVNFTNGNATTAKVAYDEASKTNTVTYDVNVDNTTLTLIDGQNGKKQIGVKTTTLTSNGTGTNKFALSNQGAGSDNGDALIKAKDIVTHLNTLAGDIQTAKGASQAGNSAGYVDADGNKVIYDSTDNKYYQANGNSNTKVEVAKDKLVAQAQTPDGTLAQMNVKSVITKERENTANGINEDNAFVKGLEKAASNNKTKNAAVTVNDLHQVASTPLTFKSDDGVHSQVNLGDTFAMTGGADYKNLSDGKNIGVVSQPDGVQFKLAKDLKDLNSVSAGGTKIDEKGVSFVDRNGQAKANTPVLSANGLDMGGKVISNVGKGTKDTDAANMQQLNEVRSLLGLGNSGGGNAGNGQVNIADIKKDPNSGSSSSSNSPAIKAGTVLGGKGNNNTEKLANGGVQVGVDKDGKANGDLNNVWVKTQKDGSKKALLTTYNVQDQTNYITNNPAEAIDRMNEQGIRFFHVNDGNQEPVVQGRNSIDSSASGRYSAAVGYQAKANGEAAVAVGRQTQAGNQSIAIGDKAQATGNQSIAIGTGNVVTGKHSGAIGDPSTVKADNSYSVGNNNQFTDATQTDVFGVGNNITVTESNSVALGSNSAISAGTQAGTQAKKSDGTAGATTTAGATGTVKGFAGQTAVGAVSVGASGAERRIQNVAAGEVSATSTDAVNGSQLYKATQGLANATNELGHRIHQNENKANAGISSAMAMASMPQAYIPGRSMVTGGIATYNGQGAVAVGLSKLSDNGQWVFKINGSADTQGNAGAAVGAGFHW